MQTPASLACAHLPTMLIHTAHCIGKHLSLQDPEVSKVSADWSHLLHLLQYLNKLLNPESVLWSFGLIKLHYTRHYLGTLYEKLLKTLYDFRYSRINILFE